MDRQSGNITSPQQSSQAVLQQTDSISPGHHLSSDENSNASNITINHHHQQQKLSDHHHRPTPRKSSGGTTTRSSSNNMSPSRRRMSNGGSSGASQLRSTVRDIVSHPQVVDSMKTLPSSKLLHELRQALSSQVHESQAKVNKAARSTDYHHSDSTSFTEQPNTSNSHNPSPSKISPSSAPIPQKQQPTHSNSLSSLNSRADGTTTNTRFVRWKSVTSDAKDISAGDFIGPNISDLSLRLTQDLRIDAFWYNLVKIFEECFYACRATLIVPNDLSDLTHTPWGVKATWYAGSSLPPAEAVTGLNKDQQLTFSREDSDSESYTDMSEIHSQSSEANHHYESTNRSQSTCYDNNDMEQSKTLHDFYDKGVFLAPEDIEAKSNGCSSIFESLQPLDYGDDYLISSSGVRNVMRSKKVQILRRDYEGVSPPANDNNNDEDEEENNRELISGVHRYYKPPFVDYEQAPTSPWINSAAPSPKIHTGPADLYFQKTNDLNQSFDLDSDESPSSESPFSIDSISTVKYDVPYTSQPIESIGLESSFSVVHIPFVHQSYQQSSSVMEDGPAPIAILSIMADIVPYPFDLISCLHSFVPHLANAYTLSMGYTDLLQNLQSSQALNRLYRKRLYKEKSRSRNRRPSISSEASFDIRRNKSRKSTDSYHHHPSSSPPAHFDRRSSTGTLEIANTALRNLELDKDNKPSLQAFPSPSLPAVESNHDNLSLSPSQKSAPSPMEKLSWASADYYCDIPPTHSTNTDGDFNYSSDYASEFTTEDNNNTRTGSANEDNPCLATDDEQYENVPPPLELLKEMIDNMPLQMFAAEPQTGKVTWLSKTILSYRRKSFGAIIKDQFVDVHPDERQSIFVTYYTGVQKGHTFRFECRIHRFDGVYHWFSCFVAPIRDRKGSTVVWIGYLMDINDERLAQTDAFRRREQLNVERRYRAMAEASSLIVFAISKDQGVSYTNEKWTLYSGQSAEEARGYGFLAYVHPQDRDICLSLIDNPDQGSVTCEIRILNKTGNYRWHIIRLTPLPDDDLGGPKQFSGSATDIHDHRMLEEKLEFSKNLAQKSVEDKARFLSNMSHEIRTPLIGISGIVNFLMDTPLTSEQLDYCQTISSSASALVTVINDILDFSKIEAGMMELENNWLAIRWLMSDISELLTALVISKDIELNFLVDSDVPVIIKGDRIRIRQILLNIVGNAIKFTSVGEVFVRCSLAKKFSRELKPSELALEFVCIDTGTGFDTRSADRMFKAFSQLDASTTREHGGTGLGLVISRQLAQLHGGDIECTSIKGKGSTFKVTIVVQLPQQDSKNSCRVTSVDNNIPEAVNDGDGELSVSSSKSSQVISDGNVKQDPFTVLVVSGPLYSRLAIEHQVRQTIDNCAPANISTAASIDEAKKVLLSNPPNTFTDLVYNSKDPQVTRDFICGLLEDERYSKLHVTVLTNPHQKLYNEKMVNGPLAKTISKRMSIVYKPTNPSRFVAVFGRSEANKESNRQLSSIFGISDDGIGGDFCSSGAAVAAKQQKLFRDARQEFVGRNIRVLLAEDNIINQKVMGRFLTKIGLSVDITSNGSECVEKYFKSDVGYYAMIMCDIHMPKLDGYQTCTLIRGWEKENHMPRAPIIALSANVMGNVREKCHEAGFSSYVSKPIDFGHLKDTVSDFVSKRVEG